MKDLVWALSFYVQFDIDIHSRFFDLRPVFGKSLNLSPRHDCIEQFTRGGSVIARARYVKILVVASV
jgi:hypothetical protein